MKIIHLGKYYPPERGGIETAVCHLAEAGVGLGHSVHCLVCNPRSTSTSVDVMSGVTIERLGTFFKVLSTPFAIGFFLRSFGEADILHVHLPNPFAELRALFYLIKNKYNPKRAKVIPFVHALPISQGWLGRIWFSKITTPLLNLSDRVLISHPYQLQAFPELNRWKKKFHLIPYTTDFSISDITDRSLEERKSSTLIIAIGRLVPYKGFSLLLEAWEKFQSRSEQNKKYKLKIVGDGPEYASLKNRIVSHQLDNSVELLGNIDDEEKFRLMEKALLLVAPSVTCAETFGISILEAMSKGLPVITTQLPTGVAALARNGECGAAVSPGSVDELELALSKLLLAPEALSRIGYRNFLFANAHHSPQVLLTHYEALLNSVVGGMQESSSEELQKAV